MSMLGNLAAESKWAVYQGAAQPLPSAMVSWPLRGSGLAALGVAGRPVREPVPTCGDDELLVRVDAVSLCSSDAKMIRLGALYPLFHGRDLERNPTRLGHEVAFTVVGVGVNRRDRYRVGQRLGIQPDIFDHGLRTCFGVLIPGGLTQYLTLSGAVLDGDAGSYVFPVPPSLGYADVALLEPWACVDAAYSPRRRLDLKPGGTLLIAGRDGDPTPYTMTRPLPSARVLLAGVPPALAAWVRSQPVTVIDVGGDWPERVPGLGANGQVDDILLLDPQQAARVEAAERLLAPEGLLALVSPHPLDRPVKVDVGRIHYEFLAYVGCRGPALDTAFGPTRNRSELRPGGVTWIAGAGGPMGRMHVQRALQLAAGPGTVIATNRGAGRLAGLAQSFGDLAAAQGRRLITLNPDADPERLPSLVHDLTGGRGLDDVVVVAAELGLMQQAAELLAPDGMLALFAGLPLGNRLPLPVHNIALYGAQVTGTSGSFLADQQRVIERTLAGRLAPAHSVAAIGGLNAAYAGMQAVIERRFAGKVVLFPQLLDLPLLDVDELAQALPAVHACLGPGLTWNAAAEQALFEALL